jgi:hypothetical protein
MLKYNVRVIEELKTYDPLLKKTTKSKRFLKNRSSQIALESI